MRIAAANLQMASTHFASQQHEIRQSLRAWVGDNEPPQAPAASVQLSDTAKSAQSSEAEAVKKGQDATDSDPRLLFIRTLVEMLIGRPIKLFDAAELNTDPAASPAPETAKAPDQPPAAPQQPAGFGVAYDYHETYTESERMDFSASGSVHTADGRAIGFEINLSLQRSYTEESNVSLRLGDAARKTDPLVLNFAGTSAQLSNTRFSFDINSDGSAEQINFVGPGSGFLVLDRNGDGKVNDGSEMFGPTSGNGFGELAGLDADRNGWIDENDPAFRQLSLWTKDQDGKDQLQPLASAGVGALALTCVNTPFDIKSYANAMQGQIRSSGVFLQEDGKAGTIQQVDLTV